MFVTLALRDFLGAWVHLGIVLCGMVCFPFEFSHHFSSLIGVIVRAADFLESIVVQDCKTQALHHCTYRFVWVLLR